MAPTPITPLTWRAVANPTRRKLIDLLRDGPRTTGDLCRAFPTSRFAVMKHLTVLEHAGIIAVRREGRDRWNALNPRPLSELESYWQGRTAQGSGPQAEGSRADSPTSDLPPVDSGRRTAHPTEPASPGQPTLTTFRIEDDVYLDVSPGQVFDALTFNVSAWWGAPYLLSPDATSLVVEAQLGGRCYEEWGHRQGVIRGIVTAVRQDELLELTGSIAGAGPLPSTVRFRLERREGGTLLCLAQAGVTDAPDTVEALRLMWRDLLKNRLKAFLEK